MEKTPVVYILASEQSGTLYIGVTSNLLSRVKLHRDGIMPGITQKFGVKDLVYFELHASMHEAIQRENQLSAWALDAKHELIEAFNPSWTDLYPSLL